ncbi:C40 family peptidase [Aquirufa sp. ROCK-SH2]
MFKLTNKRYLIVFVLLLLSSCQIWQNIKQSLGFKSNITNSFYSIHEIDQIVKNAQNYIGVPYRSGGIDEKGMDCSGLLFRIYSDQNFLIPRISNDQSNYGFPVSFDDVQKGDWIFFATGNSKNINHAGIVVDSKGGFDINFIHASTSKGVREDNLLNKFWSKAVIKVIRPFKN